MSSFDVFSMSLRNLLKRKLRSLLTIMSVVIGTAAIIVMVSLGIAVNVSMEEMVSQWGNVRQLTVRDPNAWGGGMGRVVVSGGGGMVVSGGGSASAGRTQEVPELNDEAVEAISRLPNIEAMTPVVDIQLAAVSGRYSHTWMQIRGIAPGSMETLGFDLAEGTYLPDEPNAIVFGSEIGFNFRNPNDRNSGMNFIDWDNRVSPIDLMNDRIEISWENGFGMGNDFVSDTTGPRVRPIRVNTSGVLAEGNWELSYLAFMNLDDVLRMRRDQQRYQANEGSRQIGASRNAPNVYDSIIVIVDNINNVEEVRDAINDMGFHADSMIFDILGSLQEQSQTMQLFLGAIGAVSLFVAAIGIANTMIMAIYERTKEIGVMKVIGARIKDIKRLFLLEAILIGFIGGALGVLLSLGIAYLLNNVGAGALGNIVGSGTGSRLSIIPLWLCAAALGFSSLVGLLAGYFPARRAMNLSALAAIRME